MSKQPVVGIIGAAGKYGRWLTALLGRLGYTVIGSDIHTALTNEQVVQQADVVIFAVALGTTVPVINSLTHLSRPKQLWMDVTSIKSEPVRAMLAARAEVTGLHPMCAPPASGDWRGQTVVVCKSRCRQWEPWLDRWLAQTGAIVRETTAEQHDRIAEYVQVMPHAVILLMAMVMRERGVDVSETMTYASPVYKTALGLMGRILSQDAKLYAGIQQFNPNTPTMLAELERQAARLRTIIEQMIASGDTASFEQNFTHCAEHVGEKNLQAGFALFEDIIAAMTR